MNVWDVLILAAVAGLVILAVKVLRRKKENGGCSCGCSGCPKDCAARRNNRKGSC